MKNTEFEWFFIDVTFVRAYQHAPGVKDQNISKSVGGNSSKIHLAVHANSNPIEFIISDGTRHEVKVALNLMDLLNLESNIMYK